jgi:uncharacterized protein (TIGR03083 family)
MAMAYDERREFARFVDELTPHQWDHPTLCEGWRVRDVVAHAFGYDELSHTQLLGRLLRGRFSVKRINALGVATSAWRTPEELRAVVHAHLQPRGVTTGFRRQDRVAGRHGPPARHPATIGPAAGDSTGEPHI